MPILQYLLPLAIVVLVMPARWIWVPVSVSFTLLVAANLVPHAFLSELDLHPRVFFTLFVLIALAASIRFGFEHLRKRRA